MGKKWAILSDIHANATALKLARRALATEPFEGIIFLGDLLSYGCDPMEVIDLMTQMAKALPTTFIMGNHDEFYFQMQKKDDHRLKNLRPFLQESILWTLQQLPGKLADLFPWQNAFTLEKCYFSHANPFGEGDWTYLSSESAVKAASHTLSKMGFQVGVFGHTHKPGIWGVSATGTLTAFGDTFTLKKAATQEWESIIFNPGSVGQPRGQGASMGILEIGEDEIVMTCKHLAYDYETHRTSILSSPLSEDTKIILLSYFEENY